MKKKWNDACVRLHPSFHNKNERIAPIPTPTPIPLTTSSYSPNMLLRQPLQQKFQPNRELRERVHLNPPGSPVQTDLVLGRTEVCICIKIIAMKMFIMFIKEKHKT